MPLPYKDILYEKFPEEPKIAREKGLREALAFRDGAWRNYQKKKAPRRA